MNDDCVHDPVNRVCYGFEPRGEDLVVHVRLGPGGALPPHLHPAMEERWSVAEGEVRFRLNGHERVLRAADGDVVVRPGVVHGLSSTGNGEARLRCLVTPIALLAREGKEPR